MKTRMFLKALDVVVSTAVLSGLFLLLSNTSVYAEGNTTDEVTVAIPVSCSITSTVNTEHTATVDLGTYEDEIGETVFNVFCNDANGFAVYAIGYSGDTYGNTTMIPSTVAAANGIVTGTATSGNTSNWAMKLSTVSGDYAPTLETGFNAYHAVPAEYTKVASFASSTDATTGSSFKSTYAAYISQAQPADTYTGKVKYTVIHPNDGLSPISDNQIRVVYDGNGLTFLDDYSSNNVVYDDVGTQMWIASEPDVVETSNLNNGVQDGSYSTEDHILTTKTFDGAEMVRVNISYGLSPGAFIALVEGSWGGMYNDGEPSGYYELIDTWDEQTALNESKSYTFLGDTITLEFQAETDPDNGNDYGVYVTFYPIYSSEQPGTEGTIIHSYIASYGSYSTTTTWNGKWYLVINDSVIFFNNEDEITKYLKENEDMLSGVTITLYAYNPYRIYYDGNGATAGTMSGFYTTIDTNTSSSLSDLVVPNFKRTGYGFAGWSLNQSASINSGDRIFGPNERVRGDDFSFNTNSHQTTLYAVWVPSSDVMQGWSGCSSLGSGQVVALTDNRDGNVYTVGKMQDGKCWMMENLRLDNSATINNSNTNNPSSSFTGLSPSSNDWCTSYDRACFNQSKINMNNTDIGNSTLDIAPYGESYTQWYGYGNYYNWYSATAGNGNYDKTSGATVGDICPNGWLLPTGVSGGHFSQLDVAVGGTGAYQDDYSDEQTVSNRWRKYPNNFVFSGSMYSTHQRSGYAGYYWSSTARNVSESDYLLLDSGYIFPGNYNAVKYYGFAVRCIARPVS